MSTFEQTDRVSTYRPMIVRSAYTLFSLALCAATGCIINEPDVDMSEGEHAEEVVDEQEHNAQQMPEDELPEDSEDEPMDPEDVNAEPEPEEPDYLEGLPELPAPTLPGVMFTYTEELPGHFRAAERYDNTPGDNLTTDAGAQLGRVLFWDKRLSENGTISCGSCHAPDAGFSDPRELSIGFEGGLTGRNSMQLINVRFYERGSMFWDERADTLEEQVLMPIQDDIEMGLTLDELVGRVAQTSYYEPLFEQAFGDSEVTEERISMALAQFVRAMVSYRSKWDDGVQRVDDITDDFPNYTAQENHGKRLFLGDGTAGSGVCAVCHLRDSPTAIAGPRNNVAIFQSLAPRNNGLGDTADGGVGDATGNPNDRGRFKSPTLRNIGMTAPYMHDGSLETLEDVVRFYNEGVRDVPGLDPILQARGMGPGAPTGGAIRLGLSDEDIHALVAFLETLTDEQIVDDPKFQSPFPM